MSAEGKKPTVKALAALSARGSIIGGLLTVAVLVFGFGLWSVGTTISGAILAPGQLEVDQNRQIVQHPDGGVVESISVTEAQAVKAGDLLITLDGSLLKSELSIVEGQLYESLARRGRLEAERDDKDQPKYSADLLALAAARQDVADQIEGQNRLFIARKDTLARQIDQLNRRLEQIAAQVEGVNAQVTSQQTQTSLINRE